MIPLIHDLSDETVLVFGGGPVGARRARRFDEARVVVVSPRFVDESFGDAERVERSPSPDEVAGIVDEYDPALVVCATDDAAVNDAAEAAARDRGALVNRADEAGAAGVVVPATVSDGDVTVSLSTGGASPALARRLRERVEAEIDGAGLVADVTGDLRAELKAEDVPLARRREAVRAAVRDEDVWANARDGDRAATRTAAWRTAGRVLSGGATDDDADADGRSTSEGLPTEGVVTGVAVTHHDATAEEIATAGGSDERATLADLTCHEAVREAFALQTCNRAEAYVVTERASDGREALDGFAPDVRDGAVRRLDHETSLRHLLRVAAGLESQVLGEDEIVGQVREAVETAREADALGPTLEAALTKALRVAKRARTETSINEGVTSLASAAVEVASDETTLAGETALVVGAGDVGQTAARALVDAGVGNLVVANRTVERAKRLADEIDAPATAVPLDDATERVEEAAVVVTATAGSETVVGRETLADAGETVVLDLALPPDVDADAGALDDVVVHRVDALREVTERTRERREAAAEAVAGMVDDEVERLTSRYKRARADEAIAAMYEGGERLKNRELERAKSRLDAAGGLTDDQAEALEDFADALVNGLLAPPTRSLKAAAEEDDWTTIQTAMGLFDPSVDGAPDPAGEDVDVDVGAGNRSAAGSE